MTNAPFDPLEVLRVFAAHEVRFVLIGGLAGRVWGSPTVTADLDACYDRSPDNLQCLADALVDLDARLRVGGPNEEDDDLPFLLDAETLRRGSNFTFRTRAGAVDVLGLPAGVSGYDELAANAVEEDLGGVPVKVSALDDLITMKLAAGRPKDRIEVEVLAAVRDEIEHRR
ncbi:MAG: hypothetical protein H0V52_08295 [Acidimicrobiia bacterium]|nr:hypothetical protein [Acidimicrobiia bacterium]